MNHEQLQFWRLHQSQPRTMDMLFTDTKGNVRLGKTPRDSVFGQCSGFVEYATACVTGTYGKPCKSGFGSFGNQIFGNCKRKLPEIQARIAETEQFKIARAQQEQEAIRSQQQREQEDIVRAQTLVDENTDTISAAIDLYAEADSLPTPVKEKLASTSCADLDRINAVMEGTDPDAKQRDIAALSAALSDCPEKMAFYVAQYEKELEAERRKQEAATLLSAYYGTQKALSLIESERTATISANTKSELNSACKNVIRFQKMPSASKFLLTDEALASCKNGIKAFTQEIEKPLKVAQERAQERQRKAMKARRTEEAKQHRRSGGKYIKKGSLFCSTKSQLKEQLTWLAQDVRKFAPGCLSTGADIAVVVIDWGMTMGVRGINNGKMYWIESSSLAD